MTTSNVDSHLSNNVFQQLKSVFYNTLPLTFLFLISYLLTSKQNSVSWNAFVMYGVFFAIATLIFQFHHHKETTQQIIKGFFVTTLLINLSFSPPFNFSFLGFLDSFRFFFLFLFGFASSLLLWSLQYQNLPPPITDKLKHMSAKSFDEEFPSLKNRFFVGPLLRAIYQEGWVYSLLLFGVVALSFGLRIWEVTDMDAYCDEELHLESIYSILTRGTIDYERAQIVTYLSVFFCWIGDAVGYYGYLYWSRIPSILISTLTVIPIYWLGKKANKEIGLIAAFLWAMSPWAIVMSRYVREYAYYTPVIFALAYLLLKILPLVFNYESKNLKKFVLYSLPILITLIYAFFIDSSSTLKVFILILLVITLFYMITHLDSVIATFKKYPFIFYGLLSFLAIFSIVLVLVFTSVVDIKALALAKQFVSFSQDSASMKWAGAFFKTNLKGPIHWWYEASTDTFLIYLLLLISFVFALINKHRYVLIYLLSFLFIITFYAYFFSRFYAPRYVYYYLPLFSLAIGATIYYLFSTARLFEHIGFKVAMYITIFLFVFKVFQPNISFATAKSPQIEKSLNYTTLEYHFNKKPLLEFFSQYDKASLKDEVYISTIFRSFLAAEYGAQEMYGYAYQNKERFNRIRKIMDRSESGFIVLDLLRNGGWGKGLPQEGSFTLGTNTVSMVKNFGNIQVYRWSKEEQKEALLESSEGVVTSHFDPYVDINLKRPFSISFWSKANTVSPGAPISLGEHFSGGISIGSKAVGNQGGFSFQYGPKGKCSVLKTSNINDGNWHHVVWFHSGGNTGSEIGIYVDGKLHQSCYLIQEKDAKVKFLIPDFNGDMQDMRIYNTTLKQKHVDAIYNDGEPNLEKILFDGKQAFEPIHHWVIEAEETE
ncbi:MAG: LamG-like jellyroll fold domain-containing protein [Chitinophagales bacterium]